MQSLRNTSIGRQTGATNWAFIITLIVALVFIWLWFQESDKVDGAQKAEQKAKDDLARMNAEGVKLADALEELSDVVGWKNKNFPVSYTHLTLPTKIV